MPFERESIVPFVFLLLSFIPQSGDTDFFKISEMRQNGKSAILKDIEMRPIPFKSKRGTNEYKRFSFEYIGLISIPFKMTNFPSWRISEILKSFISEPFKVQTKINEIQNIIRGTHNID